MPEIERKREAGVVMLRAKPFSAPNRNERLEIVAEISQSQAGRAEVRMRTTGVMDWMTLADSVILTNALREIAEAARGEYAKEKKRASKPAGKPVKKARKSKKGA